MSLSIAASQEYRFARDMALLGLFSGIALILHSELLVLFGGGLWVALQLKRPVHFLYALCLAYPFAYVGYSKPTIGPLTLGFDDGLLLIILAMVIIEIVIKATRIGSVDPLSSATRPIQLGIFLILAYTAATMLACVAVGESPRPWFLTIGHTLSFIAVIMLIRYRSQYELVIGTLKLSALILALGAIAHAYGIIDSSVAEFLNMRPTPHNPMLGAKLNSSGFIQNRGGYGVNMAFILPYVLSYLVDRRRTSRWSTLRWFAHLVLLFILLWSVVITGSRSTWLMAVVVIAVFTLTHTIKSTDPVAVIGLVVPVLTAGYLIIQRLIERIATAAYELRPATVDARILIDKLALLSFVKHPIFGIPHAQITGISETGNYVHNTFLVIAVDSGLVALIPVVLLYGMAVRILVSATRRSRGDVRVHAVCLFTGLAGTFVELSFYGGAEKQIWIYLGMIFAFHATMIQPWPRDDRVSRSRA